MIGWKMELNSRDSMVFFCAQKNLHHLMQSIKIHRKHPRKYSPRGFRYQEILFVPLFNFRTNLNCGTHEINIFQEIFQINP